MSDSELHKTAEAMLQAGNPMAVADFMHKGTPAEIMQRYNQLLLDLYWKAKNISAIVAVGRLGISYGSTQSEIALKSDPVESANLRSQLKQLAYNLGSFTWPGWNEPGITLTRWDIASGREGASLNLRLAIELNKPPKAMAAAHWLVGAHELAAGNFDAALVAFEQSGSLSDEHDNAVMNQGYVLLVRRAANPADFRLKTAFDSLIELLKADPSDDKKFVAEQLQTADGVFLPKNQGR